MEYIYKDLTEEQKKEYHRLACRIYRLKHRKEQYEREQAWCKKNKEYVYQYKKAYASKDEDEIKKTRCRNKTNQYIRRGIIVKLNCEVCNKKETEAHHTDYEDFKKIKWLCIKCHKKEHKRNVC